jgi:F420-dependent oxidoreductase-like protein
MRFRIFTEPQQGASYDQLLSVALAAERLGFDAFFRSDHYLKMGSVSGLPGPTDAWVTLGGLARDTSTIRLGTLVTSATFRLPGPLAVSVAQVDQMSGGRVELGLGTGWFEAEHLALGIPFPGVGERFDRLSEQLEIITGLWSTPADGSYAFDGKHYHLSGGPGLPKPVQSPHPPIIVGGGGPSRTPALAARFADEFNISFRPAPETAEAFERVGRACEKIGRDPSTLALSAGMVVCVGADDAEVARRAAAIGRDVDELKANGATGTPSEAAGWLEPFVNAGADRLYLQVLDLGDLEHLELIYAELLPLLS